MHRECFDATKNIKCPYCTMMIFDQETADEYLKRIAKKYKHVLLDLYPKSFMTSMRKLNYITKDHHEVIDFLHGAEIFVIDDKHVSDEYEESRKRSL